MKYLLEEEKTHQINSISKNRLGGNMELDDEEIRATKKIGKNEMTREEAIQIILKEKINIQFLVQGQIQHQRF